MDILNVTQQSSQNPDQTDLQGNLTVQQPSVSANLSVAEGPRDYDVFVQQPEGTFSTGYVAGNVTTATLLVNNLPATLVPPYFDDIIVGRIICNNTANGTAYTSLLDCYNDLFSNVSGNGSAIGGAGAKEPLTDFILMGVTSVILGLIILITIIGEYF
jgi:hypothetical protein